MTTPTGNRDRIVGDAGSEAVEPAASTDLATPGGHQTPGGTPVAEPLVGTVDGSRAFHASEGTSGDAEPGDAGTTAVEPSAVATRPAPAKNEQTEPVTPAGRAWAWGVLLLAGATYLAIHFGVVPRVDARRSAFVVQPLAWSGVAAVSLYVWLRRIPDRSRASIKLVLLAILIGSFQVALGILTGLMLGFGASPYSHAWRSVLDNAAFVLAPLIAIGIVRACAVGALGRHRPTLVVLLTGVFCALLTIPATRYDAIQDARSAFQFAGETILPAVAASVLASMLVWMGGPLPAIAFAVVPAAFEWLSPILPDLEWITLAFVGSMGPIVGMIVMRDQIEGPSPGRDAGEGEGPEAAPAQGHGRRWMITAAVAVTGVFAASGLLGFQPNPIVGHSMDPTFQTGDLVITRHVDPSEIAVGDVIRYRSGEEYVLHRVEAIWDGGAKPVFITRGDANNVEDLPVPAELVDGKAVLRIPKIGWLPIHFHNALARLRR